MAERFKAAVLKTVERKLRGFESLSLRHILKNASALIVHQYKSGSNRRGGRAAEGSCLLSSCGGNSTPGSNPGLSASLYPGRETFKGTSGYIVKRRKYT